jgi:hypothetical protein
MVGFENTDPLPPLRLPSTPSPAAGKGMFILGVVGAVAAILLALGLLTR